MEDNIVQIDTAIGQCHHQPTKIQNCSIYFLSRSCNYSLWNLRSLISKIAVFVESMLINKTYISMVTETWFNSCDDTVEGRCKTACNGLYNHHIPFDGRRWGGIAVVSKSCCALNKTSSFRTFQVLDVNVFVLPDIVRLVTIMILHHVNGLFQILLKNFLCIWKVLLMPMAD